MIAENDLTHRIINAIAWRVANACEFIRWQALRLRTILPKYKRHGNIKLFGFRINYTDINSLYIEYKDIFRQGIYQFNTDNKHPRIIDGGGCIGMSVLNFKKQFPGASIICFEPDHNLLNTLETNIEQNNLDNIKVVPAGLAGQAGTVSFAPDGVDGGKIVDDHDAKNTIDVVTLSKYLQSPVDFVKLNIEGMELDVLEQVASADKIHNIREMVIEYHGWPGEQQKLGQILMLLDQHGFRYLIHDFDKQTNAASKPPFRHRPKATWFCLIHAIQPNQKHLQVKSQLAA